VCVCVCVCVCVFLNSYHATLYSPPSIQGEEGLRSDILIIPCHNTKKTYFNKNLHNVLRPIGSTTLN